MTQEFRDWLGSEAATRQLAAAKAENEAPVECCTSCEEPIAAGEHFSYYGVMDDFGPLCIWCGREIAGLD